jgi:hypothetical protein
VTWRHVLVYWVAAAALGGWLWIESGWRAAVPVEEEGVAPLVDETEDLDELAIVRREGTIRFALKGGRWETVDPPGVSVTSDLVAALLDTLSTISPIEKLAESGRGSAEFGLEPPQSRILLGQRGDTVRELTIGKRNPTRTAAYAAISGEDAVYLIGLNAQYYLELIFDEVARQSDQEQG